MNLFVLLLLIVVLAVLAGAEMDNDGDGDDNISDPDPEEVPTQDDATGPSAKKAALNDTDTASTRPTSTLKNSNENAATQSTPDEDKTSASSNQHPMNPSKTTTDKGEKTTIYASIFFGRAAVINMNSTAFGTAPPMPTTIVACAMCALLLLLLLPTLP
ncbi:hypothetical protein GPALN_014697 [Globodera pallida]|nr:hypothetical protein GPALN_014697 [Globodera pallida]